MGPALCEGTCALCVRDYRETSVAIWAAVTMVDTLEVLSMERLMCSFAAVRRNQGLAGHLLPAVFSEGCTRWTPGMCLGLPVDSETWKSKVVVEQARTWIWVFGCVIGIWYMPRTPSLEFKCGEVMGTWSHR